jgi:invasion protein IalB
MTAMSFRHAVRSALVCAAIAAAPAAHAQEAAAEAAPAQQQNGPRLAGEFQDWQVLCNRIDEAGTEACEMYQLLVDESDSPVAEISIAALPFGSEFAAGATITTPLETLLPTGLGFRIGDDDEMRVEGFRVCTVVGCIVRMGLSAEEVDRMKAGSSAMIMIAPFIAPDRPVTINISLSGFTAAYEDVQTRFAEAAAAARAAGQ